MMLPLAVGYFTGHPELLWAGLGGWLGMLADPGGPYRARAEAMLWFAALGSAATFAGGIAGASPSIGVPALFASALICSLMRVRGDVAATSGVLALIMFCITEGTPAPLAGSTARGLLFAAGSLEALFISLALWPF